MDQLRKTGTDELWNGEINPQDTLVDNNPHYKELQHLQSRNKTELLESLSEDQKEKLEKYCDTTLEMNSVSEREAFASGFRIALRLACAALADKTKNNTIQPFDSKRIKGLFLYPEGGGCHVQLKQTEIYKFRKKGKSHELF